MPRSTALALAAAAFFAGGWLLPKTLSPAHAAGPNEGSGYTQCIGQSVTFLLPGEEGDKALAQSKARPIPAGWTPVGGSYSGVVLCK